MPKPSELALGKLAGALFDQRDGVWERSFATQMFEHLPVSERLQRGWTEVRFGFKELARFIEQTAAEHLFDSFIDATTQFSHGPSQSK
jgi:hypothetical protein